MTDDDAPTPRPMRCTVHGSDDAIGAAMPLLSVLAALLPLRFDDGSARVGTCRGDGDGRRTVLRLLLRTPGPGTLRLVDDRIPSLSVAAGFPDAAADGTPTPPRHGDIAFADDPRVPWPMRGRTVGVPHPEPALLAPLAADETVLASSAGAPLWVVRERDGVAHHRCALPLPALLPDDGFADVFHSQRFAELLPLLHLLRTTTGEAAWQPSRLRACFMVDDPNLHWPSYGHIDYRALIARAARHRYHVSLATVPVDCWFTHGPTAALLRQHRAQLSLTVHGNDHARNELAQPCTVSQRQALLHQALQRIARLEAASGLQVSRVMVPPHGACSAEMLASLAQAGFDATCLSTGSLRHHNPGEPWLRTAGYRLSERVGGCPVLPRWGLGGTPRNALLLAAYLGQALVLRTHHQDLKHGLDLFDEHAAFINGLAGADDAPHWAEMASLAALDYQWRVTQGLLRVRPFGGRCRIQAPPAEVLRIEPPDDDPAALPSETSWRCTAGHQAHTLRRDQRLMLAPAPVLTVEQVTLPALLPLSPLAATRRPVPPLRRVLAEARDRLSALMPVTRAPAARPSITPPVTRRP